MHLTSIPLLIALRSCGRCDKRRSRIGKVTLNQSFRYRVTSYI